MHILHYNDQKIAKKVQKIKELKEKMAKFEEQDIARYRNNYSNDNLNQTLTYINLKALNKLDNDKKQSDYNIDYFPGNKNILKTFFIYSSLFFVSLIIGYILIKYLNIDINKPFVHINL